ncbi:hypothetical protein [Paraliobacillus sediminis]|uniref:hypothetical protein n=1 Tax=Paraliobacillus sediminis TaxID=1885916 RepID=UPI000E3C9EB6|nr:hypothetical protein [Paraliobacillus sediminis]
MERSYFFDDTNTEQRIYQSADFARYHAQIIGNGVSNTLSLPDLKVEPKANMTTRIGAGYMFANGYMYENTALRDMVHETAEPTVDRIDRIVVAFDDNPEERRVYAYVKKGAASSNPVPPSLTRDNYIFEMSVAQVLIKAGKSFIEASEITDERTNTAVCGYIPLHNIYRGMEIDSGGTVSLLNQSFIKADNFSGLTFTQGTARTLPFGTIVEDKQNEITSSTSFTVKAGGIYNLWTEIGFSGGTPFPIGVDIQIYVFVNGTESFPLVAKVLQSANDNFVIANGIDRFEAGDVVSIRAIMFNTGGTSPKPDIVKQRIAKIS